LINSIHIINGPNLNLIGIREKDIYGSVSFEEYFEELKAIFPQVQLQYFQSNHEGHLIDYLHQYGFEKQTGIILNAGGLTHTSVVLGDAIAAIDTPTIEVHISDVFERESFRWKSYLSEVCIAHYIGHGLSGYKKGIDYLLATK
jgi:3-dehydroquinate dehydratase-2